MYFSYLEDNFIKS